MSFVITQPDLLTTAATQWAVLDTAMREENSVAAAPTLGAPPPAADEVSATTAARFAAHAQQYQAISARAAALQQLFIDTLRGNAESYATAEATNAAAVDPSALTTVAGAVQSVGGLVTGPGQATAVVSVISGLASGAQYLDGVLKTAGAAATSSPAEVLVSAAPQVSAAAGSGAIATDTAAPARLAAARAASTGWAGAVPGAGPAPAVAAGGVPTAAEPGGGSLVGHAAAGGMAGAAGANRTTRTASVPGTVVAPDRETPGTLRQALTEVSADPESVQHWHTDKAHLESLLDQLSAAPGVHAVHLSTGDV
ncbi:PE family protein [[Mycobacterium] nativiensis]|uniref:PE family protein n=1 Tax=[Mycobacterium] nativiensis TaxID=2855503 RepID=A0ABU5XX82_9MYCO|nr:PE family protein [Mycolicibacter sp. MYC340]MEB3032393.1 PE family protein [Mycolicibacter sp. MYC340]